MKLLFPQVSFVDANTGENVTCGYDTSYDVADPNTFGMVRWHSHPPTLPPSPVYTYHLKGVPLNAVAGTLVAANPGITKGLSAIISALQDIRGPCVHPPGRRGDPRPATEVLRLEYERIYQATGYQSVGYPDDVNEYHMQVYTWRVSDLQQIARRLRLDIYDIFTTTTTTTAGDSMFLNFAGDSYHVDPKRLEEPNHEPTWGDSVVLANGTEVFRPRPGGNPGRDRPATWHNNFSEVAGKPDPLHDFGIKLWKSDAPWGGHVTHYRYACCWQPTGSPGCLIGYPSKTRKGQPALYQWFGGFEPSEVTVKYRGTAFIERSVSDALHEKIVKALTSEPSLIDHIKAQTPLSLKEQAVVRQVAKWMYEYNTPLMGSALYIPPEITDVEAYLDRVVKGRIVTRTPAKPSVVVPPPSVVVVDKKLPNELQNLIDAAKRYDLGQGITDELHTLVKVFRRDGKVPDLAIITNNILAAVPLYMAVDVNDQWLIEKKRQKFPKTKLFDDVVRVMKALKEDEIQEKREIEAALLKPDSDLQQVLINVQRDTVFAQKFDAGASGTALREYLGTARLKAMEDPLQWLLSIRMVKKSRESQKLETDAEDKAMTAIKMLFFKPVFKPTTAQIENQRAVYTAYGKPRRFLEYLIALFEKYPKPEISSLLNTIAGQFKNIGIDFRVMDLGELDKTPREQMTFADWQRTIAQHLRNLFQNRPTKDSEEMMKKAERVYREAQKQAIDRQRRQNDVNNIRNMLIEYEKKLQTRYRLYHNAPWIPNDASGEFIQGQKGMFDAIWEMIDGMNHMVHFLKIVGQWLDLVHFDEKTRQPDLYKEAMFLAVSPEEKNQQPATFEEVSTWKKESRRLRFAGYYPFTEPWVEAHLAVLKLVIRYLQLAHVDQLPKNEIKRELEESVETIRRNLKDAVSGKK